MRPIFIKKVGNYRVAAYPDKIVLKALGDLHLLPENPFELPVCRCSPGVRGCRQGVSVEVHESGYISVEVIAGTPGHARPSRVEAHVRQERARAFIETVSRQRADLSLDLKIGKVGRQIRGRLHIRGHEIPFKAKAVAFQKGEDGKLIVRYAGDEHSIVVWISPGWVEALVTVDGHQVYLSKELKTPVESLRSVARSIVRRAK